MFKIMFSNVLLIVCRNEIDVTSPPPKKKFKWRSSLVAQWVKGLALSRQGLGSLAQELPQGRGVAKK